MRSRPWFVCLLFLPWLGASCDSEGDLCDFACECEGCSDREYDDCLYGYEDLERDAERNGCDDLYSEYVACREDTAECRHGDDFETDCGRESERLNDCRN